MFVAIRRQLAAVFDALDSRPVHAWLERLIVLTAAVGFLLHLLVVIAVRNLPGLPETALEGLDESLLHAVYTPFSVILFYEVLQLVFALAASHTGEIAKQYQIISLIVVRRVFKDIGSFENIEHWLAEPNAVRAVLLDMGGAVLMFLLVTAFTYLRRMAPKVPIDRDLGGFIELKKAVAVLLLVVLIGLAAFNLGSWLGLVPAWLEIPMPSAGDFDIFFFPAFFEFMIFTDVFLLIVSLSYYDRYEYVFRNAGFVISTVLLRVSLSTPKPYDLGLALFAMAYGVIVLAVFACFSWIARRA
ncbi:MAG: hypothetical protein O3C39_02240 [Planctomycetota bacterium]|nr:hypothetical protein [Planctomycetota bacterium]MDA1200482.1 hypothetical protein [Planctomycetota bacterium]